MLGEAVKDFKKIINFWKENENVRIEEQITHKSKENFLGSELLCFVNRVANVLS